jgi:hypothetical protein
MKWLAQASVLLFSSINAKSHIAIGRDTIVPSIAGASHSTSIQPADLLMLSKWRF